MLLRHGATLHGDNPGLSPEGAKDVRQRVASIKHLPITSILTDTKKRTNQTAAEWSRQTGKPVQRDARLDNWDLGDHEGDHTKASDDVADDLVAHPDKQPPGGGESARMYQDRLFGALRDKIASPELHGVANHSRGIRMIEAAMAHPAGQVTAENWNNKPMEPEGSALLVTPDGTKRLG